MVSRHRPGRARPRAAPCPLAAANMSASLPSVKRNAKPVPVIDRCFPRLRFLSGRLAGHFAACYGRPTGLSKENRKTRVPSLGACLASSAPGRTSGRTLSLTRPDHGRQLQYSEDDMMYGLHLLHMAQASCTLVSATRTAPDARFWRTRVREIARGGVDFAAVCVAPVVPRHRLRQHLPDFAHSHR